jgi:hypothetical protein
MPGLRVACTFGRSRAVLVNLLEIREIYSAEACDSAAGFPDSVERGRPGFFSSGGDLRVEIGLMLTSAQSAGRFECGSMWLSQTGERKQSIGIDGRRCASVLRDGISGQLRKNPLSMALVLETRAAVWSHAQLGKVEAVFQPFCETGSGAGLHRSSSSYRLAIRRYRRRPMGEHQRLARGASPHDAPAPEDARPTAPMLCTWQR